MNLRMNFSVNGIEAEFPISTEKPFHELIEYLRDHLNADNELISSIRVNGTELSGDDEVALGSVPLSTFNRIEVFTAHPRELAEDTLQSLVEFSGYLEEFSKGTSDALLKDIGAPEFTKLIDGITTFTEALDGAKRILRVGLHEQVNLLEADLLSILKDVLHYQQSGEVAYVAELLATHLPENLAEWRTEGLPALIRSRDS